MHEIRTIRAAGAGFDAALARRGALAVSDDLLARDASRRAAQTALQDKQARRNAIAKQIGENRRKGIDVMLDIVEQRAPQGFENLDSVLPPQELEKIVADYKQLVAQDRETLLKLAKAQ